MEMNDMTSIWQNAGRADKAAADFQQMIQSPEIRKIKTRLWIEACIFGLLLVVYYDGFDGHQKPLYANVLLVVSLLAIITKDIVGYRGLVIPAFDTSIKKTINNLLSRTVRLARLSVLLSVVYSISLLAYFGSVIHFTREKGFLLLGAVIVAIQLLLWSQRVWARSIGHLRTQLQAFEEAEDV